MSKKTMLLAGLITLILVASVAGAALAAPGDDMPAALDAYGRPDGPGGRGAHLRGEITALGEEEFTLEIEEGERFTVVVDDDTRYFGDLESFDDLEVGLTVAVATLRNGEDNPMAKAVGAGEIIDGARARGEVSEVNGNSLSLETRDGETLTFEVNNETQFVSRDDTVTSLDDIEVGDHVMVIYAEDGADLVALLIAAGGPPSGRPGGTIPPGGPQS